MKYVQVLAQAAALLLVCLPAAKAAPAPGRHVVLMDFAQPPPSQPPSSRIALPQASKSDAMMADFAAMNGRETTDPLMMAGSWPLDPDSGAANPDDACNARFYQPSALLKPAAEARRRIYYPLVRQVACAEGLPVTLVDALLIQESGYNPVALSPKGAFGLGQLMPATARQLGIDRFSTSGNLRGAARYLRQLITQFGAVHLALAAYNAGPERVKSARGLPAIPETLTYVRRVLVNWSILETRGSHSEVFLP